MAEEWIKAMLAGGVAEDFKPHARYCDEGKQLELHLSDESYYAKQISPTLTIYIGRETNRIVGAVVGGVLKDPWPAKPTPLSPPPA